MVEIKMMTQLLTELEKKDEEEKGSEAEMKCVAILRYGHNSRDTSKTALVQHHTPVEESR